MELLGKSREELRAYCRELGEPAYRGEQIYHWLYGEREFAIERMSNLPAGLRERLRREATIRLPRDVGVVATVHGGLGSIDTHGLKEEDGQYVNDAYGKSPTTIHLSVNGGIGSIRLQQQ